MRIFLLTILANLFSFCYAAAQPGGSVSGSIKGPAGGATVSLLRAKDSTVLTTLAAQKDGSFLFGPLAPGSYLVSASAAGHRKAFSAPFSLKEGQSALRLPPLPLAPVARDLAGVTVTAQRPPVEHKVDRTIVNVEAAITNAGANALEVLEKSPGILVDKDGNISLKGKEGVLVLVDGRPTHLGGADLANLLRNMNAGQLDQVEIMTNPPARYDAAGNAGVINLKTKKKTTAGYSGGVNGAYTQGRYAKTSGGGNMTYRAGKLALFGNLNYSANRNFERLTIQRHLRDPQTGALENHFDQYNDKNMKGSSYNGKIGLDYFATKKTTLGVSLSGAYSPFRSANAN